MCSAWSAHEGCLSGTERGVVCLTRTKCPLCLRSPPQQREETRACQGRCGARQLCQSLSWSIAGAGAGHLVSLTAGAARAADVSPRRKEHLDFPWHVGLCWSAPAVCTRALLCWGQRRGGLCKAASVPPCCSRPLNPSNCLWERRKTDRLWM